MSHRGKHRHGVFHQLGVAQLADMKNFVTHGFENRLMFIEERFRPGQPERQGSGCRRFFHAAGGTIEHRPAFF